MGEKMNEQISGAAGVAAGWKLIGGAVGALGIGAAFAALIVMLMTPPRTAKEWAVGLVSTVMGSIGGGAAVIQYFSLHLWMESFTGLIATLGLAFACGLPAWALVRWIFTYIQNRQGKDVTDLIKEAREIVR